MFQWLKIRWLEQRLRSKEREARLNAVRELESLGNISVESLIVALQDPESSVGEAAAEALGRLGDPRAVEPLLAALKDRQVNVRSKAAQALGQLGDPRAVKPLFAAIQGDDDSFVKWTVVEALRQFASADVIARVLIELSEPGAAGHSQERDIAVRLLLEALKDPDQEVRRNAAELLGELVDARAVNPLIVAFRDSESRVRKAAVEALEKLGASAVNPLIVALGDSAPLVRGTAAEALGRLKDLRAVGPLIAALQGRNIRPRVGQANDKNLTHDIANARKAAAEALGKLGDTRAVEPLIAELKNCNGYMRFYFVKALGQLGDTRAVEPLLKILDLKTDEGVVRDALVALVRTDAGRTLSEQQLRVMTNISDIHRTIREAYTVPGDSCGNPPVDYAASYDHVDFGDLRQLARQELARQELAWQELARENAEREELARQEVARQEWEMVKPTLTPSSAGQPAQSLNLTCPDCLKEFRVSVVHAGRQILCPVCQSSMIVPLKRPEPSGENST